jgi:hypothetical protein
VGTLFPDANGHPELNMRAATGREGTASVGCTRAGVDVWLIGAVILVEIFGIGGFRKKTRKPVFRYFRFRILHRNDTDLEKGGAYLQD